MINSNGWPPIKPKKLSVKSEKFHGSIENPRKEYKDKNTKLRSKNDELTKDNQILSKHYTEKKAFIEEMQAKVYF